MKRENMEIRATRKRRDSPLIDREKVRDQGTDEPDFAMLQRETSEERGEMKDGGGWGFGG